MNVLSTLDWSILLAYATLVFGMSFVFSRRSGKSVQEYFLAGRRLPWWLAGTSMAAAAFNVDTPLYVTKLVRSGGIWKNWQWWGLATSGMLAVFFFARLWRRANVLTDVELTQLRYSGGVARLLRGFRSAYFAIAINCLAMAMGIIAVEKVTRVAFGWEDRTAIYFFAALGTVYTLVSGHFGVAVAHVIQFTLSMTGSIILCVYAVSAVGGLGALRERIVAMPSGDTTLGLVPSSGSMNGLEFLVYVGVLWWAYQNADGGGKIVQKMSAAKDERHALLATLWFNVLHYAVRSWPWILTALASLVLLPDLADAEAAYPKLIVTLLPSGIRGLMAASLLAAFLSTVDGQLNWGASYLLNDLYRPFVRPGKSDAHYVRTSKVFVLLSMALAVGISTLSTSVLSVFQYILAFGAGTGLVYVLRWFWWRINAWTEVSAMIASAVTSSVCYALELSYPVVLLVTVSVSVVTWVTVTLLTAPVDLDHLVRFYERVKPPGFWGPVRARVGHDVEVPADTRDSVRMWIASTIAILSVTLLPGALLFGSTAASVGLGTALVISTLVAIGGYRQGSLPRVSAPAKPAVMSERIA